MNAFRLKKILLVLLFFNSMNAFSYKIIPGESVHESITAMAVKCMQASEEIKPADCSSFRYIKSEGFKLTDYVRGLDPLYRSVSWPDDPTREFTEFSGALASGAKVYLKNETGCPREIGYEYRLDKDGIFCSSHFGDLQFLHAQAAKTTERASKTHSKIIDWSLFLYGVAIEQINTTDDYCEFWKKRNGPISNAMVPDDFAYCEERFSFKKLFTFRYPYYPEWTVGTLLNFTCKNPLSSKTCSERIGDTGKEWSKQNAGGALFHLIQDSYSQSHTDRGPCEVDPSTNKVVSKIECLPIKRYYAYGVQDGDLHGEADFWPKFSTSCNSITETIVPVLAIAQIMWHINNKTLDVHIVKNDLYKVFGKPENTGDELAVSGKCF